LICRSGDRSAAASHLLAEAGFKNVYSVVDGFEGDLATDGPKAGQRAVNGWKNAGLPWSYKSTRPRCITSTIRPDDHSRAAPVRRVGKGALVAPCHHPNHRALWWARRKCAFAHPTICF
jgi:hypothetical protein